MNAQKFTKKALEAINSAQSIAIENQNMQIMPEHLLYALVDQEGGLIPQLFKKMGVDTDNFLALLDGAIGRIPAVSGSGREPDKIYISPVTDKIFSEASGWQTPCATNTFPSSTSCSLSSTTRRTKSKISSARSALRRTRSSPN